MKKFLGVYGVRWLATAFEERQSKESKMKKFLGVLGVAGVLVLGKMVVRARKILR